MKSVPRICLLAAIGTLAMTLPGLAAPAAPGEYMRAAPTEPPPTQLAQRRTWRTIEEAQQARGGDYKRTSKKKAKKAKKSKRSAKKMR